MQAIPSLAAPSDAAGGVGPGLSAVLAKILDEVDYGLMLVTGNARVLFANRVAWRDCGPEHALRFDGRHVLPQELGEREPFVKALTAARNGRRSMLTLRHASQLLSLAVVPLDGLPEGAESAAALLVFGKRSTCESLTVEFYAQAHHLTSAESAVLKSLCSGLRPTQIAKDAGIAVSTVRTHIGAVRVKTGSRSIGELIRRVAILPPIVPALA
jgi:DNA-binding CsgD family transcriptional regulator